MSPRTFLLGARSGAGRALVASGMEGLVPVSRRSGPCILALDAFLEEDLEDADRVISLAPVSALVGPLAEALARAPGIVVITSTTSIDVKQASADAAERASVDALLRAELGLRERREGGSHPTVTLRSTILYGPGQTRGVNSLAGWLRRSRVALLPARADGLRQPLLCSDLAALCRVVADRSDPGDQLLRVGGGERLSYADMVSRLQAAMGLAQRSLRIPGGLLRAAVATLRLLPGQGHLSSGLVDRMGEDLVVDDEAVWRRFGIVPERFRPELALEGPA